MLSYSDITDYKFEKAGFGGGYRPEDVDKFMLRIAADFRQIETEKAELEQKLMTLAGKVEEYREDEESLRAALLGAQKLGDSIIRESKQKGEMIVAAARGEAQRVTDDFHRQLDREQGTLTKLQQEVTTFKNRLLLLYRQHLDLVNALPGEVVQHKESAPGKTVPVQEPAPEPQETAQPPESMPAQEEQAPEPQDRVQEYRPASERTPRRERPFEGEHKQQGTQEPQVQKEGFHYAPPEEEQSFADELFSPEQMGDDFSSVVEGHMESEIRHAPSDEPSQEETEPKRESRFGELRFGDGYDLRRN